MRPTFRLLERMDGQLDIDNMREVVVKSTANGRVTDRVRTSVRGVEFELLVSILADLDSASKRLLDLVYSLNYRRAVHPRTVQKSASDQADSKVRATHLCTRHPSSWT